MDFSYVLRNEEKLRPSCIPWELHGDGINGGTAHFSPGSEMLNLPPLTSMSVVQLQCSNF